MLHSFKLKIMLLSTLASGLVLFASGLFALSVIRRIGLERIDRELRALGDAQVRRSRPPDHWRRFAYSLDAIYGAEGRKQFLVRVEDRGGARLFATAPWPSGLTARVFGIAGPTNLAPRRPWRAMERWHAGPRFPQPEGEGRGPPPPRMAVRTPVFVTAPAGAQAWRLAVLGNEEVSVVLGQNLAAFEQELRRFRNAFLVAAPLLLVLLAAAGWWLADQALRPVQVIAATAERVTARGLAQRVPALDADREFRRLIDVINRMLDRLEQSFQQALRFSADAAHELKTPLTILQGQLDQALQAAPAGSAEQGHYADALEEVRRLAAMVRKLLLLSQADSGRMKLARERFDLRRELELLVQDIQLVAPHLRVTCQLPPEAWMMADPDLFRQALQNLLNNAVKHNYEGGAIRLDLARDAAGMRLTIANTARGLVRMDRERLFDRFYRGDPAHSRTVDGAGLGLSLAREIVRAHGGELDVTALDGEWITFALTLPAAAAG